MSATDLQKLNASISQLERFDPLKFEDPEL